MTKKTVAIIGGGPAGMMAAYQLSKVHDVVLFEKEKTLGRKFLVAGKGGFNLTNSATGTNLVGAYTPSSFLEASLLGFDSVACREWLSSLEIPSFIGSSGRVFPEKGIKPIEVLQKLKRALLAQGTQIKLKHKFIGFDEEGKPQIDNEDKIETIEADYYIFALGGASWSKTGSDGKWKNIFKGFGIETLPFEASNCGININWSSSVKIHAGKPLKNMAFQIGDEKRKGEAVISDYGLEGNAIYPLIPAVRNALKTKDTPKILLDFKPSNSLEELGTKLKGRTNLKTKDYAKLFQLHPQQLAILKAYTSKSEFLASALFVKKLKNLSIPVDSLRPIEEAISTIGGIDLVALNPDFSLKQYPQIFVVGEMLNWDAPTGGYLLQACFSTAYTAAQAILKR